MQSSALAHQELLTESNVELVVGSSASGELLGAQPSNSSTEKRLPIETHLQAPTAEGAAQIVGKQTLSCPLLIFEPGCSSSAFEIAKDIHAHSLVTMLLECCLASASQVAYSAPVILHASSSPSTATEQAA